MNMMYLPSFLQAPLLTWAQGIMHSRDPNEIITRKYEEPYMQRWYVARRTGYDIDSIYVHHFVRSDAEELHDHPCANLSLVLRGEYTETTPQGKFTRRAGDIVYRTAEQAHAIQEVEPGTITLFIFFRREREWGFHTADGWIHHSLFRAWKDAQTLEIAA